VHAADGRNPIGGADFAEDDRIDARHSTLARNRLFEQRWPHSWPLWKQYVVGFIVAAAALGLRWMLGPILGDRVPFLTLFMLLLPLTVLIRPGPFFASAVAGLLGVWFLFIPPSFTFLVKDAGSQTQLLLALISIAAAGLTAWLSQRAQDRARAMDTLLGAFVDDSPMLKWVTDGSGRIVYANRAVAAALGTTPAEISGRRYADLLPAEVAQMTLSNIQAVRATGRIQVSIEPLRNEGDGERRMVEWRRFPLRLDSSVELLGAGIGIDVTEKLKLEREARQTEAAYHAKAEELRALLEIAPVQIWFGDADCTAVYGNTRAYEESRLKPGINASFGAPIRELPDGLRVEANGRVLETEELPMQVAARSGRAVENFEHELVHADGVRQTMLANVSPLFGTDGTVRGVVGAYVDITERKRLEREMQLADRRKDEFLATMAHELRNPLAPIVNAVHFLKQRSSSDHELNWCRDVIERQVTQMSRLLDDLLDVSRISYGKLELRSEKVALAAIIRSAIETSRPLIDQAGHRIEVELPAQPIELVADPVRLAQVLSNLLNNAAKYTDSGGHIGITATREDGVVSISVRDDGIGIDAEVLPHVFTMFSQARPKAVRAQGGLGIGLSLVRGLVELHGGAVEARSAGPGKGSEFIVRIPAHAAETSGTQAPHRSEPAMAGGAGIRRIVVADDLRDSCDSLALLLRLAGHHVWTAYGGEEAAAAAEQFRPDVLFLDIGMPDLDGYEVCRRVRSQTWGRSVLIVALTGWGQEEDRRRAEEAGFDRHLVKPADPSLVMTLLASLPSARARATG
jgi:PAS domain S-box-containing protein